MWLGHHLHLITCSHHCGSSALGVAAYGVASKETSLGLAIFLLDGNILVSKLGKIASWLYALPENKLENFKLENLKFKNLKT